MKKLSALILALILACAAGCGLSRAAAETGLSYEGTVVAGETVPVTAPFGGRVKDVNLKAGSRVLAGDTLARIDTTLNYAPVEGTVTGLYAAEGDATESVTERYGAVLYIEPTRRYVLTATSEKAYNASENYFVHLGETVYLSCVSDGSHQGTGIVSALTEKGYNIEVTGGDFYLGEKVDIFRAPDYDTSTRIGRGTADRAKPVAVKGTGSVLKLHVKEGDFVERGELLFETVEGALDGLYAPESGIPCPVTGVVASVDKNTGDAAAKGDILMKIVPEESMRIQFLVPEMDLFSLREGQPVSMELYWDNDSSASYKGTITEISHVSEETKEPTDRKNFRAYASFTPDEKIRLGMTMIVYPGSKPEESEE